MKPIASVTPITAAKNARTKAIASVAAAGAKSIVSAVSDFEAAIPRDRWDRPLIIPPDGGDPRPYRRASSVAEAIEDHYGLHQWELRLTAQGLAARPDLVFAVQTAKTPRDVGKIVEEAMEQAGRNTASRNGSTVHRLTDMLDHGQDVPAGLAINVEAMIDKYIEVTSVLEVLGTERFVVQDKIEVAGTYDRLVRVKSGKHKGRVLIGDLKTGQRLQYLGVKTAGQLAAYAAGVHYDLDGDRETHGAERDWGLLIHLPWAEHPDDARCDLLWMDLRIGRKAIAEAMRIDRFRKIKHTQVQSRF